MPAWSELTRTPTPCVTMTSAGLMLLTVRARTSQTVFAQRIAGHRARDPGEGLLARGATQILLIGEVQFLVLDRAHAHAGRLMRRRRVVRPDQRGEIRRPVAGDVGTQRVRVPQGLRTALAGLAMNSVLITLSIAC